MARHDLRVDVGFWGHVKTKRLRSRLGADGVLALMQLWAYCAGSERTDGSLAGLADEDIELAVDWPGEPGALVQALVAGHWLDGPEGERQIHGWLEHQPWLAGAAERSHRARQSADARWGKQSVLHAERMRGACEAHANSMLLSSPILSDQTSPSETLINRPAAASPTARASRGPGRRQEESEDDLGDEDRPQAVLDAYREILVAVGAKPCSALTRNLRWSILRATEAAHGAERDVELPELRAAMERVRDRAPGLVANIRLSSLLKDNGGALQAIRDGEWDERARSNGRPVARDPTPEEEARRLADLKAAIAELAARRAMR